MRIAFIDTMGLPFNGNTLNERGLGGSEAATIHIAKALSDLGEGSITSYDLWDAYPYTHV